MKWTRTLERTHRRSRAGDRATRSAIPRCTAAGSVLSLALAACSGSDTTNVQSIGALTPAQPEVTEPTPSSEPPPGENGSATGSPGQPAPLYLAASWVTNAETTSTYVSVFDSLDVERLDFANAVEIAGYGDAWVHEGQIFISEGESPRVGRYTLGDDGALRLDVEIDFSAYGVAGAAFWDNQFLSPTKAYLSNPAGLEYIVWNPTTMQITGTVSWPDIDFGNGLDVFHSYTDRGGVVVDGYFYHGLYAHDEGFTTFGESSVITVYDIATDELVSTIDVPCPMMDVASLGDDGNIYVSGWSYIPLSYLAGYSTKNCAARINVASRTVDPSWLLNYTDVAGGEQGSALRAVAGNDGIFAVFHGTGIAVTEDMDMWDLDAGEDDWELYSINLADRSVAPTGIEMSDGSYYESHVDGRYYVYLASSASATRVWERTATGYEPKFEASGWMSRLFRVR
jgi:hypothetical protein